MREREPIHFLGHGVVVFLTVRVSTYENVFFEDLRLDAVEDVADFVHFLRNFIEAGVHHRTVVKVENQPENKREDISRQKDDQRVIELDLLLLLALVPVFVHHEKPERAENHCED